MADPMKNRLLPSGDKKTPIKLIPLESNRSKALRTKVVNRKVCDVIRSKKFDTTQFTGSVIPYLQWKGSTETEYFVITFYSGVLTLDINERECLLEKEPPTIVAVAELLGEIQREPIPEKENDPIFNQKLQLSKQYLTNTYLHDVESLHFAEIMKVLKWKFVSRKVKEVESLFDD